MNRAYEFENYLSGEIADGSTAREISTPDADCLACPRGCMWALLIEFATAASMAFVYFAWRAL